MSTTSWTLALEVQAIAAADEAGGFAEVEDADFAARAQHAEDLAQSGVVIGEIAEAEGGGDEIEGGVGHGKPESVGLEPAE